MSVGLLIITHERIASVMADTAMAMLGRCPLPLAVLPVASDCDPDQLRKDAQAQVEMLDQGDGVLVLTDMYGSTPSNVAGSLIQIDRVQVVSGINLPMLVRVMNYPQLDLARLAEKAVSGGREGVFICPGQEHD
ncbi:MAG: PTS fructose transporter subunit IIA [Gammaproteobacteria bacterium]|jgi:mannose PTS system EIIA component